MIPCVSLAGDATKIICVGTEHVFCRDKTLLLSRQKYACRDKHNFISLLLSRQTSVCRDKTRLFFATKVCLSGQKFCRIILSRLAYFVETKDVFALRVLSRQTHFCRDKTFVTRKIILIAAPANGT